MIIFFMVFILTFIASDTLKEKGTISLIPVGKVSSSVKLAKRSCSGEDNLLLLIQT